MIKHIKEFFKKIGFGSYEDFVGYKITDIESFKKSTEIYSKRKTFAFIAAILIPGLAIFLGHMARALILGNLGFYALIIGLIFMISLERSAQDAYARYVLTALAKKVLPDAEINCDSNFDTSMVFKSRLIKSGNETKKDTHFVSKDFEYTNLCENDTVKINGRTHRIKLFNGFIIKSKLTRKLNYVRVVTSNKVMNHEVTEKWPNKFGNESIIDVENIEFNENFQVYSKDEHSAYLLLTPYVTERLLKLNKRFNEFSLAIVGDTLYLAVYTNNTLLSIPKDISNFDSDAEERNIKSFLKLVNEISEYISGGV